MNTMPSFPVVPGLSDKTCVSIIGMAGAGKSSVGQALAARIGWAHVDVDYLIEATYGVSLQTIADTLDKERFLDVEARVLQSLRMQRAVVSTGGSVVYRPEAMRTLASLGAIVYLDVPLPLILERIARNPDRGLAIAPGQTIEDLFHERQALYTQWATCRIPSGELTISQSVDAILQHFDTV